MCPDCCKGPAHLADIPYNIFSVYCVWQAVVRSYNSSNVSLIGEVDSQNPRIKGRLDCGGTYWICMAYRGSTDPKRPHDSPFCHSPYQPIQSNKTCCTPQPGGLPCPDQLPECNERPRCVHFVGGSQLTVRNLVMRNSPFWNLHFQFARDVLVEGVEIYQYPNAANADGIDIDSTSDVVVRETIVDSNDDMLCVKSGADWLGRQAAVPSTNVLFENCEVRSGHGLTIGSEMSGDNRPF